MAQIPPAMHPLLGTDPAAVTSAQLQRLIGMEEGQHLEFKQELDSSKKGPHELALDVTAFANAGGGLLVIGAVEDPQTGAAVEISGIPGTGVDELLRIDQILGSRVQPPLPVTTARVRLDTGPEVVLVAVEAGPLRPHAVLDGTSRLSYPVRRGRKKDYLSEAAVADAYSQRFTSADQRTSALRHLHQEGIAGLSMTHQAWLVTSMLPSNLGTGMLRPGMERQAADWFNHTEEVSQGRAGGKAWNARVGYRSVVATDSDELPSRRAILRTDGSGTIARGVNTGWRGPNGLSSQPIDGGERFYVRNLAQVLSVLLDGLIGLTSHAKASGATGLADTIVQLVAADGCIGCTTSPGETVATAMFLNPPKEVSGSSLPSDRTIDLSRLPESADALLQAAQLLTLDLVSEFGHADVGVVDHQGRVVASAATATAPHLVVWATRSGASII